MELSTIVFLTLGIVSSLIIMLLLVSYIGYRMKQRDDSASQNATLFNYQTLRTEPIPTSERKWY